MKNYQKKSKEIVFWRLKIWESVVTEKTKSHSLYLCEYLQNLNFKSMFWLF